MTPCLPSKALNHINKMKLRQDRIGYAKDRFPKYKSEKLTFFTHWVNRKILDEAVLPPEQLTIKTKTLQIHNQHHFKTSCEKFDNFISFLFMLFTIGILLTNCQTNFKKLNFPAKCCRCKHKTSRSSTFFVRICIPDFQLVHSNRCDAFFLLPQISRSQVSSHRPFLTSRCGKWFGARTFIFCYKSARQFIKHTCCNKSAGKSLLVKSLRFLTLYSSASNITERPLNTAPMLGILGIFNLFTTLYS